MSKPFSDLLSRLSPEAQARVEERTSQLLRRTEVKQMEEGEVAIAITRWVVMAVMFVSALPVSCAMFSRHEVRLAIEAGADPIAARCGIIGTDGVADAMICAQRASRP